MKDILSRPNIIDRNVATADYDADFIGIPIGWYVAPTIFNTSLELYNFVGGT